MTTAQTTPTFATDRPAWLQAVALAGSFAAAVALGGGFATWVAPGSDLVWGVLSVALLLTFIGGMAAWGAIAASIMARAFFNGDLVAALLRFFLRGRRREDLPRIEMRHEVILDAARRVFAWARIFTLLACAVACLAAPVIGFASPGSFAATAGGSALLIVAYGAGLCALARRGYLLPPDLE